MMSEERESINEFLDNAYTAQIQESISDGVFTVDEQWRIASFNRAAEEIPGIARHEVIGQRYADVFRAGMCENRSPFTGS